MQIINKGDLKILIPTDGYELVSKKTGIVSDKIWLAKSDSADNYIEVMKENYVSGLSELKEKGDIDLLLMMETLDSLIMLLEPVLVSMPFTLSETSNNPIEKIAVFYAEMIKRGFKDLKDIPLSLQDLVSESLNN